MRYKSDGNYKLALDEFNKAITENPNDVSYYEVRGNVFFALKDYNKAVSDYDKALSIEKGPLTYMSRGLAYLRMDNPDKAIADFNSSTELDSSNPIPYFFIAKINMAKGNKAMAEEAIRKVEPLVKHDAQLQDELAEYKRQIGLMK